MQIDGAPKERQSQETRKAAHVLLEEPSRKGLLSCTAAGLAQHMLLVVKR